MSKQFEEMDLATFGDKYIESEMRARFSYADGMCHMAWDDGSVWIESQDTSKLDETRRHPRFCRKASADVAAATAALIIAGDIGDIGETGSSTNTALYAIAEPFWAGVPTNLRPIP